MRGHAALRLLTAGLGLALPATAQDKSAIETERPWARASIGTASPAAAYDTLVNTGSEAMRLVAVETPIACRAVTHRTVIDGDVLRMEEAEIVAVDGTDLVGGTSVTVRVAHGGRRINEQRRC